ncbi:MoxR family ATPase [Streptomyces sp. NBC_01304]|nr:MoxR family ATPase [Streptomyces sp. NBC_01304]
MPEAPPWRIPGGSAHRPYLIGADQVDVVNAALRLRRPLLVTGRPGSGKSSLARAIADDLGLGPVLTWPVNTRSTLGEALYRYDAIGRLREQQMGDYQEQARDVGHYIRLGPLGTALATQHHGLPRLLLIDELDKSDIDLPNDLLVVLEEGRFEIPELSRLPDEQQQDGVAVGVAGSHELHLVRDGVVRCVEFPFVLITSNGEREFPPAFLRRCVRLELPYPDEKQLTEIVRAHFATEREPDGARQWEQITELIREFVARRTLRELATDQLLHAVHLLRQDVRPDDHLREAVLSELGDSARPG